MVVEARLSSLLRRPDHINSIIATLREKRGLSRLLRQTSLTSQLDHHVAPSMCARYSTYRSCTPPSPSTLDLLSHQPATKDEPPHPDLAAAIPIRYAHQYRLLRASDIRLHEPSMS